MGQGHKCRVRIKTASDWVILYNQLVMMLLSKWALKVASQDVVRLAFAKRKRSISIVFVLFLFFFLFFTSKNVLFDRDFPFRSWYKKIPVRFCKIFVYQLRLITTSKQIELESPSGSGFVANSKPDQPGPFSSIRKNYVRTNIFLTFFCNC